MNAGLITSFFTLLLGCGNNNTTQTSALTGRWVEVNNQTDTLTFGMFDAPDIMLLSRGNESSYGEQRPKSGSGTYRYKLLPGRIQLNWILSSDGSFHEFYFKQEENKIK